MTDSLRRPSLLVGFHRSISHRPTGGIQWPWNCFVEKKSNEIGNNFVANCNPTWQTVESSSTPLMLCESNLLKTVQSRLERLYVMKLDTATKEVWNILLEKIFHVVVCCFTWGRAESDGNSFFTKSGTKNDKKKHFLFRLKVTILSKSTWALSTMSNIYQNLPMLAFVKGKDLFRRIPKPLISFLDYNVLSQKRHKTSFDDTKRLWHIHRSSQIKREEC